MDFLSKTMMASRAKFPRIIQVKPYSGSTSDEDGEKENHITRETSPFSSIPIREKTPAARARSLEHLPGDTTVPDTTTRLKSFDRKYGRSLGTPDLAPVFTATNTQSFTIKNSNMATDDLQPQKSPVKRWAKW